MSNEAIEPVASITGNEEVQEQTPGALPAGAENFNINEEIVKSVEDLKIKHRKFYDEMVKHLAQQITNELKKLPEKLRKIRKEAERA